MSLSLTHHASRPLTFDRDKVYIQREPTQSGKPRGLWVSVDGEDDWPAFCGSGAWPLKPVAHQVILHPDANILHVSSLSLMESFHVTFVTATDFEHRKGLRESSWPIDWRKVAATYDGIIIAPYQWSLVRPLNWYYKWDCASGCIWSTRAIQSVQLLGEVNA